MLNVLDLGVKNDGSADISEIVNTHTAKGTLYFPAGIYKVAKPLWLKQPICGDGYARVPAVNATRTWFVSEIANTNASVGVVNFGGNVQVNVARIAIKCKSGECGIRIGDCRQGTPTFISQVGIFDMRGYGLYVVGSGSRPVFAQDMTIFGSRDYPVPGVGIRIQGPADCRLSNIEIMGARIGLETFNGYTYADNLHLWMGPMAGKDNGSWWTGTRGVVVGVGSVFAGSEIYLDTCFHAIEQLDGTGSVTIHNLMYWEDGSTKGAPDRNGAFFLVADGSQGTLTVHGGLVGVGGRDGREGWMRHVYSPGQKFDGVLIKSDYALKAGNLERLCLGGALPDYMVRYAAKGWCRVADIFTNAKTGSCSGILALDDGAAWRVTCTKGRDGKVSTTAKPLNALAEDGVVKTVEEDGLVRVFVRRDTADPVSARFTTTYMGDFFRPLDHGSLRDKGGKPRHHEVRAKLD